MKILLLGASGQLGKEWQKFVERSNSNIDLLTYNSSQLDITHYKEMSDELRKQQPDAVVNCAAYTDVDGAEEERKAARKVNVEAVLYLTELSNELGFKLIHYSTDYVFPGTKDDHKKNPDGYSEDHSANPVNWYGKTKWEGEQAIRQTTDDYLIIRLSWLCGEYGGNFVKTMLKLGSERDELQVVNDQWGSPTFTKNVVQNSLGLLGLEVAGIYHITSKGLITWYDFAKAIFEMSGIGVSLKPVSSQEFPTKARRPYFSKLNTERIELIENCEIIDWQEGLRALLNQLE